MENVKSILPGFLIVVVTALFVRLLSYFSLPIPEVMLGMVTGVILGNLFTLPQKYEAGLIFCYNIILKTAIVLLGFKIYLSDIINIGGSALMLISISFTLALVLSFFLGRMFKIPKKMAALIGVGTAVCGNTAIVAVAPCISATKVETSFAIATNTVFGMLAIFLFPAIGRYLGLSNEFFGLWSGIAINDTSQVLAASFSYSEVALDFATTVKLTRNSLLGLVVIIMTYIFRENTGQKKTGLGRIFKLPLFVILFLLVSTFNSFGGREFLMKISPHFLSYNKEVIKFCILMALTGIGFTTHLKAMFKIGFRPFVFGLLLATLLSAFNYIAIATIIF